MNTKKLCRTTASVLLVGAATCALVSGGAHAAGEFDGVEVNIMTFTGPQIAEPLQRRAPDFNAATGAKINIVTVPFSDLYGKLLTDWASGTNAIDAAVFAPQWAVDYVVPGFLESLSQRVAADEALQQDDIAPFFREFSQKYAGETYMLTLDGDFQLVYYRSDVFDDAGLPAPETWEDYIAAAAKLHGTDMNGDGTPDYGSCISKKRGAQAYWAILSIAGGFLQSRGTSQGIFFDTDTMAPLANNEGFAAALDVYTETTAYGPPDEINLDVGDTRGLFTSGRCALTIDWGDIGTLAIDPANSQVVDKVGTIMLPGSRNVLDRASGKLVPCDAGTCPHAVNGVNRAPFAAFGGWSGGINANADDRVKDAAYAFFSYMSQPAQSNEDVTIGRTGFNPYRLSQFGDIDLWVKAGMSRAAAQDYLGAIQDSLNSPNMVLDLRIPKNQAYQQVVLDNALARLLAGEIDRTKAMRAIEDGWNELNEENGVDEQHAAYRATLGR
ncbi:MAG: extracellular solute-binding protein [Thiotrichales bacterium]|nr:extracellular solute-binding protein [Thiotrichales bacterium]MCY4286690.1 extracellular solute-binding protein [Thiotrichales bacterium]MCY4349233.1 extracellular solute-binding protein [Thiotrichales bacterium]